MRVLKLDPRQKKSADMTVKISISLKFLLPFFPAPRSPFLAFSQNSNKVFSILPPSWIECILILWFIVWKLKFCFENYPNFSSLSPSFIFYCILDCIDNSYTIEFNSSFPSTKFFYSPELVMIDNSFVCFPNLWLIAASLERSSRIPTWSNPTCTNIVYCFEWLRGCLYLLRVSFFVLILLN